LGRLPIDHVLVPADAVGTAWLGQDAGSDHLPVIAKVTFRP
jgi:endonuclease/exonuclease/phosphatase (EEP) superfamily protein YafD